MPLHISNICRRCIVRIKNIKGRKNMFLLFIMCLALIGVAQMFMYFRWPKRNQTVYPPMNFGIPYHRNKCSNKFERDMFDELIKLGCYPHTQVHEKRYSLDFVVYGSGVAAGRKVCIETDGEVWHNKAHDEKRDAYLKSIGYSDVIRVKYKPWRQNKRACMQEVEMKLYTLQMLPESHPSYQLQFQLNS